MAAYVKLCKPISAVASGDLGDRSLQTQIVLLQNKLNNLHKQTDSNNTYCVTREAQNPTHKYINYGKQKINTVPITVINQYIGWAKKVGHYI